MASSGRRPTPDGSGTQQKAGSAVRGQPSRTVTQGHQTEASDRPGELIEESQPANSEAGLMDQVSSRLPFTMHGNERELLCPAQQIDIIRQLKRKPPRDKNGESSGPGGSGVSKADHLEKAAAPPGEASLENSGLTRLSTEEFLDLAIASIRSGKVTEDQADDRVVGAARDLFGSWQRGMKAALEELMEQYTERVGGRILRGDLPGARGAVAELRSYVDAVASAGILDPSGGSGRSTSRGKGLLRLLESKIAALNASVSRLESELQHLRSLVPEAKIDFSWSARSYEIAQDFKVGELIYHPGFGIGIVTGIETARRIGVLFSRGKIKERTLVMQRLR